MGQDIYDTDDFWDLTARVKTKEKSTMTPFSSSPRLSLLEDAPKEADEEQLRIEKECTLSAFEGERAHDEQVYEPLSNPLIRRVSIRHFNDKYDFYDGFRKSALLYYDVKGEACDFVPFYSYMPQYAQMNPQQKAYYFYLRDEIRMGRYPKADYSYLYLLVYEILNLPEKIIPEQGVRMLCSLWREYRKALPRIDRYFSVWVQDYCLVWQLPSPANLIRDFIYDILKECSLREFYLSDICSACLDGALTLVSLLSDYDWRCGRYATGESARVYQAHMEGALSYVLSALFPKEIEKIRQAPLERIVRDAFPNSLCTHSVKCRLEIQYHPLSSASELRMTVSALVRYIENKLRKCLGIKSRLTVKDLPAEYRELVDVYFDTLFKEAEKKTQSRLVPQYEENYDAPCEPLSSDGAARIERESWETTYRLVEDREDIDVQEEIRESDGDNAPTDAYTEGNTANGFTAEELTVLEMLLRNRLCDAIAYANTLTVPLDYIVDGINGKAAELLGDVVIEDSEDGYTIIEDYREDIELWLMK